MMGNAQYNCRLIITLHVRAREFDDIHAVKSCFRVHMRKLPSRWVDLSQILDLNYQNNWLMLVFFLLCILSYFKL